MGNILPEQCFLVLMEQYHRFLKKSFSPDRKGGRRAIFCYAKIRKERRISNTIAREMQKTATFPNESKISRRKVWSVSKIRVSLHPQTATQCTPQCSDGGIGRRVGLKHR